MEVSDTARGNKGICYVVLVFNNITELFFCLWSIWDDRNTYILCVDSKSSVECRRFCEVLVERFENILSAGTHVGSWGGYSLVDATLRGMQIALGAGRDWLHLCLLSGNHIALRSQSDIHADLEPCKSYLRSERVSKIPRPSDDAFLSHSGIHRRLWGRFEEIPGIKSVMTGIRDELPDVEFFKGSQWVVLSKPACESLFDPSAMALSNFFKQTFVPDETYFHTIVRLIEEPENIRPLDTTYNRWNGGRAAHLSVVDYESGVKSGRMFARKLPASIDRDFIETISHQCYCLNLYDFADRLKSHTKSVQVDAFLDDDLCISQPLYIDKQNIGRHEGSERVLAVLRESLGTDAIVGDADIDRLEVLIEPSAVLPGQSPLIGIARSGDGNSIWFTIQLQSTLFSDEVATRLIGSSILKDVLDPTFEETHMEPRFREFFQRALRTAYIIKIDQIESIQERMRLKHFALVLMKAWDCLSKGT